MATQTKTPAQRTATAANPQTDFEVTLTKTKETKGAVRYDNVELGLNIYFRKEQVTKEGQKEFPSSVVVRVEFKY